MAQLQNQAPLIDSRSLITTSKGWDLRIFRDENSARRFMCALCHNVCRNAHELSCSNAHLFCEQCIKEYTNNNSNTTTCPIDHELNVTHQASRFVTRHIQALHVYCPRSKLVCSKLMKHARFNNNTLFCNFQGTLQNLVDHTAHQCIFNVIACPFHLIGCPTNKMYRYELQKHINGAQNKHISLALQKIQKLQQSLKQKEDSNEIYQEQLRALKTASRTKDEQIDKLQFETDKIKMNNHKLVTEINRLKNDLFSSNKQIVSYSKAVNLLKENNSKLAAEVDALSTSANMQQYSDPYVQQAAYDNNYEQQQEEESEISNQFSALLSLQRANAESYSKNNSMLGAMQSSELSSEMDGSRSQGVGGGLGLVGGDEKQPNSTDVVCAFLKDHPEIVSKLKNSNQIMYANIITDDKYAAQFLKKMLQSGNEDYRNEISDIVQRLQT